MKASAKFTIVDNTGKEYSSEISVNVYSSNFMQELKNKIMSVYGVSVEQIKSLEDINITRA